MFAALAVPSLNEHLTVLPKFRLADEFGGAGK